MPTFNYKAKDRAGNTVTGAVEADSPSHAASVLRERGELPMDIRAANRAAIAPGQPRPPALRQFLDIFWTGVGVRTLALFYRQMAVLLASGMTVSEALRSIGGRSRGRMRRIIDEAVGEVERGNPVTRVMAMHPRVFGPLQISMLQAGESGGLLQSMVERLAGYLEFELGIRRMVGKALFYPAVIVVFIIVMPHVPILVLSGFPAFAASLWGSIRVLLQWLIIALIAMKLLFQVRFVRLSWDFIKIQPPVLGTAARKVAMSRFSRAFAMLYSAGVPIGNALESAADACANLYISGALKSARPGIEAGQGLASSLERLRVLSPIVADMLATGEKTGDIDSVLHKASDYLESETEATVHKVGIGVFALAIVGAGIKVAIMVVQFYTGYFNSMLGGAGQ